MEPEPVPWLSSDSSDSPVITSAVRKYNEILLVAKEFKRFDEITINWLSVKSKDATAYTMSVPSEVVSVTPVKTATVRKYIMEVIAANGGEMRIWDYTSDLDMKIDDLIASKVKRGKHLTAAMYWLFSSGKYLHKDEDPDDYGGP